VRILSAKYGLISPTDRISGYDLKMDDRRAREMRSDVTRELDRILRRVGYSEVFVNCGQDYFRALTDSLLLTDPKLRVIYAHGGIGFRMAQMKKWLGRVLA
jgi:cytoplasmic iron level regulating protein YaaA (DUF328/UPF0246 family)